MCLSAALVVMKAILVARPWTKEKVDYILERQQGAPKVLNPKTQNNPPIPFKPKP